MTAYCETVEIINPKGLHARASAKLSRLAASLPARITLSRAGETANACSIMELLTLTAAFGQAVRVCAEGENAEESLRSVCELIKQGFGEL